MKISPHETEYISAPNITPLVDVSLILVIIFMVTAPMLMQAGIRVLESKTGVAVGKHAASENICINLKASGELTLNGKSVGWKTLPGELQKALRKSKDKLVAITAEEETMVDDVVRLLDISRQNGARKLAIMKDSRRKT
ncbi:biopolymer transporter ExbD [Candidatus Desantisbacteria bacterium]|nr:biopolymer transporter ExbD [Candidatus Desantisbacteria bacterium]